jgi:hypothetical protein
MGSVLPLKKPIDANYWTGPDEGEYMINVFLVFKIT